MFEITFDLGRVTDWLGLLINTLAFSSGLILLWMTRRSVATLLTQIRSQSINQAIEAHKTLYMPIVQDPALSKLIAGTESEMYRRNMLVSMLINHASRLFAEISVGNLEFIQLSEFKADLLDMFRADAVRARWPEVRAYHHPEFVRFVDAALASTVEAKDGRTDT